MNEIYPQTIQEQQAAEELKILQAHRREMLTASIPAQDALFAEFMKGQVDYATPHKGMMQDWGRKFRADLQGWPVTILSEKGPSIVDNTTGSDITDSAVDYLEPAKTTHLRSAITMLPDGLEFSNMLQQHESIKRRVMAAFLNNEISIFNDVANTRLNKVNMWIQSDETGFGGQQLDLVTADTPETRQLHIHLSSTSDSILPFLSMDQSKENPREEHKNIKGVLNKGDLTGDPLSELNLSYMWDKKDYAAFPSRALSALSSNNTLYTFSDRQPSNLPAEAAQFYITSLFELIAGSEFQGRDRRNNH